MNKVILAALMMLLSVAFATAQKVNLSGTVSEINADKHKGVPFAAMAIFSGKDSTKVVSQAICDIDGKYIFKGLNVGNYTIQVNCLGYKTVKEPLRIAIPSFGDAATKSFTLKEDLIALEEVAVVAHTKRQDLNKTTYLITADDRKVATHSIDLLSKIPQIGYDPITQKLNSQQGNVKVLINGANATEQDLLALDARVVKNIENYDFPPARYAGYASVVNIITKKLDQGFTGNVSLQHAFNTLFGNDNLYLKYNWGKNQLSLSGSTYLRGYDDVSVDNSYRLCLVVKNITVQSIPTHLLAMTTTT